MTSSMPPGGSREEQPGTEYLEQGGGAPLGREPRSGGRRKAVLSGVAVVALGAVGAGAWAAASFFSTGAQPAEALPASTLGYASIDLDPSGGQKIEAIRMLNKFPAFKDEIGLDTDDDIKRRVFEEAEVSQACAGLDYAQDIEPWLGERAAVAAVDLGDKGPVPVAVLQVKDADGASAGLASLRECGDGVGGWQITGDWAVVAETDAVASQVAEATDQGTLADDASYLKWTGEAGDSGVLNLYVAPEAGDYLAEHTDDLGFPFGPMAGGAGVADSSGGSAAYRSELEIQSGPQLPDEMVEGLRDFAGVAATVRFDDGALEVEAVGEPSMLRRGYFDTEAGDDVLASLPQDTAAAIGVGLQDGWAQRVVEQFTGIFGSGGDEEQLVREAEQWTGLELPEDLETLFGDSTVLSVGHDFDAEAFATSEDGSGIPIGIKVKGDPAEVERVLDKLRESLGSQDGGPLLSRSEGEMVAVGPDDDYLARIVADGELGDTDAFQNVVREAERAGAIVFVNFNAGGDWLGQMVDDDPDGQKNVAPLEGFGVSVWKDGDTAHGLIRLTTD
jgi:hypothetical protein